jgi:ElaB/YqjD/DUF883 family membrane-anchored ribosome-binding protein
MNGSGSEVFNTPQNGAAAAADIADQVAAVGRDLQSKAADLAGASGEALKGHASELVETAKDVASKAGDRLQETIAQQKGAGADYVSNLAQTMRRAAGEFDAEVPLAATYIRKAADQVTNAADAFREGNLNDLVQRAQSFARNQPTAFVGLAVLAGFGAIRFLKSASSTSPAPTGDETFKSSVGLGN